MYVYIYNWRVIYLMNKPFEPTLIGVPGVATTAMMLYPLENLI